MFAQWGEISEREPDGNAPRLLVVVAVPRPRLMTAGVIIGRRVPGVGAGGVIPGGMTVGAGMVGGMRIARGMTEVARGMKEIAVAGGEGRVIVAGLGVVAGGVGCSLIVPCMVGVGGGMLVGV